MMMAPVDVISDISRLSPYPYVVAPAHQLMTPETLQRLRSYAEAGGNLILTVRTGHKDIRGHLWEGMWAEPMYDLIGASIPMYDLLPGNNTGTITATGREYRWGTWAEVLEARPGTEVLATHADQFYSGKAAAITRKLGKGTVTYIGVDFVDGEFERAMLQRVYAPTKPASLPPGLIVDWRDGLWIATNFSLQPQSIPAGPSAKMLIGERQVPSAGIAVWTE
jgi:beta-galactosidase